MDDGRAVEPRAAGGFPLATSHCADDEVRLATVDDSVGQHGVRRLMRQILLAGKEPDECAALLRRVVTNRAAQHRVLRLERIKHAALGYLAVDIEVHLAADASKVAQMRRQYDPDHGSVCTSTDSTGGKSCTIDVQLSPASFDA